VLRRGLRLEGSLFLLVAAPNGLGRDRLGLVAGRRQGTAVQRNRLKRLVREAFRGARRSERSGCDLVVLPRPELLLSPLREIQHELRQRLRRLDARLVAGARPDPRD
jgi:ribonuclease P protein component